MFTQMSAGGPAASFAADSCVESCARHVRMLMTDSGRCVILLVLIIRDKTYHSVSLPDTRQRSPHDCASAADSRGGGEQ